MRCWRARNIYSAFYGKQGLSALYGERRSGDLHRETGFECFISKNAARVRFMEKRGSSAFMEKRGSSVLWLAMFSALMGKRSRRKAHRRRAFRISWLNRTPCRGKKRFSNSRENRVRRARLLRPTLHYVFSGCGIKGPASGHFIALVIASDYHYCGAIPRKAHPTSNI